MAHLPIALYFYGVIAIGRKGLYEDWLTDDKLILLEGWARDGLTDEQIAHNMGIGYTTFKEWKSRFPSFAAVLKKGKEVVDFAVENALLKKALGGDTTAMIFWLKNRKPKQWRDHPEAREDSELLTTAKKLLEGVNSVID